MDIIEFREYKTNRVIRIPLVESCAVIGSSGILLKSNYGFQIDKHQIIIRCNDAPSRGYENHVGSKTSLRVVNHVSIPNLNHSLVNNIDYLVITGPSKILNSKTIRDKLDSLRCRKIIFDDNYMNMLGVLYERMTGIPKIPGIWISTGFISIMIGMMLSKRTNLYGFGCARLKEQNIGHHYYGKQINQLQYFKNPNHKFIAEWNGILRYSQNNQSKLVIWP